MTANNDALRDRLWDAILGELNLAYSQGAAGDASTNMAAADRLRALSADRGEAVVVLPARVENKPGFLPEVISFNNIRNAVIDEVAALNNAATPPSPAESADKPLLFDGFSERGIAATVRRAQAESAAQSAPVAAPDGAPSQVSGAVEHIIKAHCDGMQVCCGRGNSSSYNEPPECCGQPDDLGALLRAAMTQPQPGRVEGMPVHVRASAEFLAERLDQAPCDRENVSDCVRCNAIVLARHMLGIKPPPLRTAKAAVPTAGGAK